jgi:hypothetical protein
LGIGNSDAIIRSLKKKLNENKVPSKVQNSETGELIYFDLYTCGKDIDGIFRDVLIFMHLKPFFFNEPLIDLLNYITICPFSTQLNFDERLHDEICSLRYGRLKERLETSSEELNIHKEKVIEMISKYRLPPEMEHFLLEIDKLYELPDWQTVNSGMIGSLRSFFELLVKSIAGEIKKKTGEEYVKDPNKSEMGIKRAYIKKHLMLSSKDDKLINSFVNILNEEEAMHLPLKKSISC